MRYTWLVALTLTSAACGDARETSDASDDMTVACPKITATTPWNLNAKRGVDFWVCSYTYAVTGEPLFVTYISNHNKTPTLQFYDFQPAGDSSAWFREVSDNESSAHVYWSFEPTASPSMGVMATTFSAKDRQEFENKTALAASLEQ